MVHSSKFLRLLLSPEFIRVVKFDAPIIFYIVSLVIKVELVSKELNYFGVIAGLFWQIGGHSSRFVLFCSF